jgi:phosphatidylglycerophosphate synthase
MQVANMIGWFQCILLAAVVVVLLLSVPDYIWLKVGRFISPNQLSILHVPVALVAYFYFYDRNGDFISFAVLMALSGIMDRLDGHLAKVQDVYLKLPPPKTFWQALSHRGGTELGKSLDPAMDKLALMPIYIDIAYDYFVFVLKDGMSIELKAVYLIGAGLIAACILTDVLGTIIRLDYFKRKGILNSAGSTWAGKSKSTIQWFFFIFYPIHDQNWIPDFNFSYTVVIDFLLLSILVLAIMSLISKMTSLKQEWTKTFEHSVD